ncbi:DoxX family protein [Candidatus Nanopelagicales bacterium]|nr:DoxX family protein [Candidatus Nanopelagicales bacterium]
MEKIRALLFNTQRSGGAAWAPTIVRWVAGVILISVSLSKFTRHQDLVDAFERYSIPLPEASVYLAGTVEFLGGLFLILGLLTRLAALAVAGNMTVAVLTGGRVDPDFQHLWLGLILLLGALFVLWAGPGRIAIDNKFVAEPEPS